ncbi:MAG: LTA synthase family protein [Desulfovibrionaceae bacterium]|nr:LTA synthase family protein [Desulfovibrionaceae bacterium]
MRRKTALFFLAAVAALLFQEILARRSLVGAVSWIGEHPAAALLNLLLSGMVLAGVMALAGKWRAGLGLGCGLLGLMALTNSVKLGMLNTPFFAWDLIYLRQMYALGEAMVSGRTILAVGLFAAGVVVWCCRGGRDRLPLAARAAMFGVVAGLAALFAFEETSPAGHLGIENKIWNQTENHAQNGFLLAFSMNASPLFVSRPDKYDEELVTRLLAHNAELRQDQREAPAAPVSLVVLMSESFSDLPGVLFTTDENPLENFQRLAAHFPSFRLVSPSFGGDTSLVEFEALTGLSNAFLPQGVVPYQHYLRRPTPSLASVLGGRGYRTAAVHPYHDWFWSRDVVYPNMGFSAYHALSDFDEWATRGYFISDAALVDKIIEVIEAGDGPFFIHAVSMQNHGPYIPGRFGEDEIAVQGDFPEDVGRVLGTYLSGVRDADRELGRLLRYLETRPEPVICLFFGDHQPSIAKDLAPYRLAGAVIANEVGEDMFLADTPGLVWANHPDMLDAGDIPERISPSYLPAILLHQMGIPLPPHMFYLRQGLMNYPVVHRKFVLDREGALTPFDAMRRERYFCDLEVLQYDLLFGAKYSDRQ